MSAPNDGGPAFPLETSTAILNPGMTLRDYFAAKAMQGWLSHTEEITNVTAFASSCYEMADAMLKAREVAP